MTFEKEQFAGAVALWKEWNERINVVSRKDIDNLFEHHILHSLAICQYLSVNGYVGGDAGLPAAALDDREIGVMAVCGPSRQTGNLDSRDREAKDVFVASQQIGNLDSRNRGENDVFVASQQTAALDDRKIGVMAVCGSGLQAGSLPETFLDVGCGGGFPGVPLAMVMPEAEFTLCDSIGKKVKVAQAVVDGLGLKNVKCVNARAEELPGQFDWIVSRAVTSLDNFYPWVKGKFRKGILYLKGGDVNAEISAMCSRCRVNPSSVSVWPVRDWLDDDYFSEKFVIHVRK